MLFSSWYEVNANAEWLIVPPHPTSRRSILILSSYLRLGLPRGLVPSGFPTKALYAPLLSPIHRRISLIPRHRVIFRNMISFLR